MSYGAITMYDPTIRTASASTIVATLLIVLLAPLMASTPKVSMKVVNTIEAVACPLIIEVTLDVDSAIRSDDSSYYNLNWETGFLTLWVDYSAPSSVSRDAFMASSSIEQEYLLRILMKERASRPLKGRLKRGEVFSRIHLFDALQLLPDRGFSQVAPGSVVRYKQVSPRDPLLSSLRVHRTSEILFDLFQNTFLFDEPGSYAIRAEYYGPGMVERAVSNVLRIRVKDVDHADSQDYEQYARLSPFFQPGASESNATILTELASRTSKPSYVKYASYLLSVYLSDEILTWGGGTTRRYAEDWKYYSETHTLCSEKMRRFTEPTLMSPCTVALAVADLLSRDSQSRAETALARLRGLTDDDPSSRHAYVAARLLREYGANAARH